MSQEKAIRRIVVIGPGMMGHAIAQEFAAAGYAGIALAPLVGVVDPGGEAR